MIQLERFENKVLFKDEFQEMGYLYSDEIEYSLKIIGLSKFIMENIKDGLYLRNGNRLRVKNIV
ncbi:hypothetical protein Q5M85_18525 [Paraclostridium bifermentans]|nr:hypothetical protein [Paraclostridium bifermentans]